MLATGIDPARRSDPAESICAVVVTYHPDPGWPDRMAIVAGEAGAVVVVDNGSGGSEVELISQVAARSSAHLIRNADNLGLAVALNQGVAWAWRRGFRWALLLDQDTQPLPGISAELLRVFHLASAGGRRVAVVGSNFTDRTTGQLRNPSAGGAPGGWLPCKTVITAGALIEKDAYTFIGPFREEFFVDSVDHDFCLRARSMGYQVVMATRPLMLHTIGSGAARSILGVRVVTSNHSPERRYYMVRNRIILSKQYARREPRWAVSNLLGLARESILALLVERHRLAKARCMVAGAWDGLTGTLLRRPGAAGEPGRKGPA